MPVVSLEAPLQRAGRTKDVVQVSHCEHVRLNRNTRLWLFYTRCFYHFICKCPCLAYYMNYFIHATPVHPSLCLQYFNPAVYRNHRYCCFILFPLLLYYCHCYKTVATDKLLRASLFPGAAELTTHLLRLIFILWLPLCRINKFGFYFPRRLLRSPILVGYQIPQ